MAKKPKEWIIAKEDAVFWLDKNGDWHNEHGKFQHKKIIDYFHSAIEKGVLFVFNVIEADDIILELNTKRRVKLKPRKLFIKEDSLYMAEKDEIIKFAEHALMRISKLLEYENDRYFIRVKARRYAIKNVAASQPV
jgi:hypothetical protein